MNQRSDQRTNRAFVGIAGATKPLGGLGLSMDRVVNLELPEAFTTKDMARMQKDLEVMAGKLRDHPEDMRVLLHACVNNDLENARSIAAKHGISEKEFSKAGGGLLWLVVGAVALGVLLYPTKAY